ncbi:SDR family oxidoreductase [Nonomuraea sp. 10N515B]|uniref:SDR family oxidoreductase n=1 Tax=Nonomuraea sp. 10N515B TaxID=3457422 RepID=UPI003FCE605F
MARAAAAASNPRGRRIGKSSSCGRRWTAPHSGATHIDLSFYVSAVYGAAKAGLLSFSRGLTYELKDRGIRVNGLSPGPTESAPSRRRPHLHHHLGFNGDGGDGLTPAVRAARPAGRQLTRPGVTPTSIDRHVALVRAFTKRRGAPLSRSAVASSVPERQPQTGEFWVLSAYQ